MFEIGYIIGCIIVISFILFNFIQGRKEDKKVKKAWEDNARHWIEREIKENMVTICGTPDLVSSWDDYVL